MNALLMTMLLVAGEAPSAETQATAVYALPGYVDPVIGIQPGRIGPRNKTGVPLTKAWLFRYTIRNGTTYLPAYDYRTQFDYSWHSRMLKYRLAHQYHYHAAAGTNSLDLQEDLREEVPPRSVTEVMQKPIVEPRVGSSSRKRSADDD